MKHTQLFEGFLNEAKNPTWEITSPILSIKNSRGLELKVGDLARIKKYDKKYEKIKEIKVGIGGNFQIVLENYELSINANEIEKKRK